MDQLKEFLKQCVKYRFWIAVGISLLLPIIGYFVGSASINAATTKEEAAIKAADADIKKYTTPNLPNVQYQPIVAEKKEILAKDVDATWRRLYAVQAPLLRWPEQVEPEFRKWGRKWPVDVDRGQVQKAIIDYTIDYPNFVSNVYKTFKPWNPEDGKGIVAAPDEKTLILPAPFTVEAPPELGAVWAEQERLWVMTALLDVVAKANDSVGAKDWDSAIIKQINAIEVGTPTAQDQKSLAKGVTLVEAPVLNPDGTTTDPAAAAAPAAPIEAAGAAGMMASMMGGGNAAKADTVYSLPTTPDQEFKILPVRMTVLVDQAHLPDFLVGLENSPMTIQVMETEIAKPMTPVVKPVYGEKLEFGMMGGYGGMMGGAGMRGMMESMRGGNMMPGYGSGMGGPGMAGGAGMRGMMESMGGYGPMGNQTSAAKKGTDIRGTDKAKERREAQKKDAAAGKAATKSKVDLYYNIIEVTVYGQARFYNAPPPPAQDQPSTAQSPAPTAPAEEPKAETPKTETPKAEAPKVEAPAKSETPAATAPAPSPDASKAEAPKSEAPKGEAPATTKPEGPATKP